MSLNYVRASTARHELFCSEYAIIQLVGSPHRTAKRCGSCREHDVLVTADEARMTDRHYGKHISIASLPGMWERTVTVNSAGKSFTVTGWKIGYAIAPAPLDGCTRRTCRISATATPLQAAVAEARRGVTF